MPPRVNRALGQLLDGLFPNYCCFCELRSGRSLPLCLSCQQQLPLNAHCCRRCALPLPSGPGPNLAAPEADIGRTCGACLSRPPPFQRVIAPWIYDEQLALLIHRWKYRGEQRLTPMLAQLWLSAVPVLPEIDLMVPVPLHWRKLWRRGFNQASLLASELKYLSPAVARTDLANRGVGRLRDTAEQSRMGAAQRGRNLRAAFTVNRPCANLRVAIVDDVMTTGATASALSRELLAAGAARVEVWCLARTPAPGTGATSRG